MKSILSKSLIIIIILLMALIISVYIFIQTYYFKNLLKTTINRAVNSAIDQQFTIGSIKGNIISNIKFEDIQFIVEGETFLKIDQLSTEYSLPLLISVLFRGDIPLQNTKLTGAEINLIRNKNGVWNFDEIKKDKNKKDDKDDKNIANLFLNNSTIGDLKLVIDDDFKDDFLEFYIYESKFTIDLIGLYKKFILTADDINADFNKLGGLKARNLKANAVITKHNITFKNLSTFINGMEIQGQGIVNNFKSPDFKVSVYLNEYKPNDIGVFNAYLKTDGKMYETSNIVAEAELSFIDSTLSGKRVWTSLEKIKMKGTKIDINGNLNSEFGSSSIKGYVDLKQILAKRGLNEYEFEINLNDLLIKDLFEVIGTKPDILTIDNKLNTNTVFTANGFWTEGSDFTTNLNISKLKLKVDDQGFLEASGSVQVFLDHVTFDLQTNTNNFHVSTLVNVVDNSVLLNSNINVTGDIPYKDINDNFVLSLVGNFDDSEIYGFSVKNGDIDSVYEDKVLKVKSLDISSDLFDVNAKGSGNKNTGLNLTFEASSGDLRFLSSLYEPLQFSGSLKSNGKLTGNIENPKLSVDADIKNFRYKDELYFKTGSTRLVTEFRENKIFDIDSDFQEFEYKNIELQDLKVITKTTQENIKIDLNGDFNDSNNIISNLVIYDFTSTSKKVEIDTLKLNFDDQTVSNPDKLIISLSPNKVNFDSFLLKSNESEIYANGYVNYNDGQSELTVNIKNLDSSLISDMLLSKTEFQGTTDLNLNLDGRLRNPNLELTVNSDNLTVNKFESDSFTLSINSKDSKTTIDLREKNDDRPYSTITGVINAPINLYNLSRLTDSKLNLNINLNQMNMSPLLYLNANIKDLYGDLTTDLDMTGTLVKPVLDGTVKFDNVGVIALPLQNVINLNNAQINFQNNQASLTTTELTSQNGNAEISASADLNEFKYKMDGNLNNLYVKHPLFSTKLSGDLNLDGKYEKIEIIGKLKLNNLKIDIKNQYEKKQVSDIKFVDVPETESTVAVETDGDYYNENVAVDLELDIPNNTWLTGMGAKVVIKGDLSINKKFGKDQIISGTINTERGNYTAFGRLFKVEKGFINFPSITEFNPLIDLTASYEIQDNDIFINIIGTAEKPKINLSSSPPMDKSDIISYLVFGTSSANLGSSQRNVSQELASNIAMGELAEVISPKLGLDVLSVQGSEEGGFADPQVKVGSYIDDNLYVGYERTPSSLAGASTEPQDKVKVEYKINDSFSLESIVGGDNTGADVFYNIDF
ncbi:MAG: translocation/assembly module TamB domain-containing protein [Thermodesulfobacteriota bacterium]